MYDNEELHRRKYARPGVVHACNKRSFVAMHIGCIVFLCVYIAWRRAQTPFSEAVIHLSRYPRLPCSSFTWVFRRQKILNSYCRLYGATAAADVGDDRDARVARASQSPPSWRPYRMPSNWSVSILIYLKTRLVKKKKKICIVINFKILRTICWSRVLDYFWITVYILWRAPI